MSVNLTVILGAGSARDVVNPNSNQQINNSIFRPPITADLFNTHRDWEDEYLKFPAVAEVIEELRARYPNDRTSADVENLLKELKDSSASHRNNQFRQFPLYLQHYFSAISNNYCKKPTNYFTLINKIFDLEIGKVVFLTTNYDLLFDSALHYSSATKFAKDDPNMDKYISQNSWAYIKLHGSVDWGRSFVERIIINKGSTLDALIDTVNQMGSFLEQNLEPSIMRDDTYNRTERRLMYPAISVPIGDSKLNCPDKHVSVLKDHLNNCQHFLIIGFSGYDEDILRLLDEKENGFGKVLFVSGSEEGANNARLKFMNFGELGQKLQTHALTYPGNGFDEFVRSSDGLIEFLGTLV